VGLYSCLRTRLLCLQKGLKEVLLTIPNWPQRLQVSRLLLGPGFVFWHQVSFWFVVACDDLSENYASGYLYFYTGGVFCQRIFGWLLWRWVSVCCTRGFRATPGLQSSEKDCLPSTQIICLNLPCTWNIKLPIKWPCLNSLCTFNTKSAINWLCLNFLCIWNMELLLNWWRKYCVMKLFCWMQRSQVSTNCCRNRICSLRMILRFTHW